MSLEIDTLDGRLGFEVRSLAGDDVSDVRLFAQELLDLTGPAE